MDWPHLSKEFTCNFKGNKNIATRGPSSDAESQIGLLLDSFGPERHVIAESYKFVMWIGGEIFVQWLYTNPTTSPKTLTMLNLTLADPHDAFESFRAPVFRDFIRNYSVSELGPLVASKNVLNRNLFFSSRICRSSCDKLHAFR